MQPFEVSNRILLLDDAINRQIVLLWHLIPTHLRGGASKYELDCAVAALVGTDPQSAGARVDALLGIGLINDDGTIAEEAGTYLDRVAQAKWHGLTRSEPGEDEDREYSIS